MINPTTAIFIAQSIGYAAKTIGNIKGANVRANQNKLESAQAKLAAEESALTLAQQYREATSYNFALAAMGVGTESGLRGVMAKSGQALRDDLRKVELTKKFIDASTAMQTSLSQAGLIQSLVKDTTETIGESVLMAQKLGLFNKKGK